MTPPNQHSEAPAGKPALTYESLPVMISMGRLFIVIGVALVVIGVLLTCSNFFSFLRLGRLPGDISVKRGNFSFYFPVTTSILLSLLLTLVLYLLRRR